MPGHDAAEPGGGDRHVAAAARDVEHGRARAQVGGVGQALGMGTIRVPISAKSPLAQVACWRALTAARSRIGATATAMSCLQSLVSTIGRVLVKRQCTTDRANLSRRMSETETRTEPEPHACASAQRRRAQPQRDPPRGRAARHGRGHRRALDRPAGRGGRDEQERSLRPLRLQGGAPARHDRDGGRAVRAARGRAGSDGGRRASSGCAALAENFLRHVEDDVFPGGCFFASVAAELDTHPGPVRDLAIEVVDEWIDPARDRRPRRAGRGRDRRRPRMPSSSPSSSTRTCCSRTRST